MNKIINLFLVSGAAVLCGCTAVSDKKPTMEQEYISMIREWEDPAELASIPWLNWQSKCECKILYSSKKFASFMIESWSYTGGAHGMTKTRVGTIRNGRILKLADLSGNVPALWEQAVVKHFKAASFEALLKSRKAFKPRITENFYLDAKGIHFIYDPYEIDSFGAGTIDIFVPYKF